VSAAVATRRLRVPRGVTAPRVALAGLALVGAVAWAAYPVRPTYDTFWSLVWGRELLDGHAASFDAYRAPTEHPLWVALGTLLAPLGDAGARTLSAVSVASMVAFVAGVWRLGRATVGATAATIAALLLLTRLDFAFYAAFAYVDVPYLALLAWAAALEAERPRRGGVVWVLLVAAGLLRPEGWAYAAVYAVWMRRWRGALWVVAPIALWSLLDLAMTGNPLFSLTETTDHAASFGRQRSLVELPGSILGALDELLKPPVLVAGALGLALALRRLPRERLRVPLALLVLGTATYVVIALQGFSAQVPRYLAVAAIALLLFAGWLGAVALAWRGRLAVVAAVALLAGVAWSAARLHPGHVPSELRFRHAVEVDLDRLLGWDAFARARRCGPVSVPTHKLVPLVAWRLHLRGPEVVARSERAAPRGAAIYVLGSRLLRHPAYGPFSPDTRDPALVTQVPAAGQVPVGRSRYFAVYAGCGG